MTRRTIGLAATIFLGAGVVACLAACGSGSGDGAGGVSASEAGALNDAAAVLDARTGEARTGDSGINPAAMASARADRHRITPDGNAITNADDPSGH